MPSKPAATPPSPLILGPCVGGGLEIACACDLRIAGESARLGAPINKLGFSMYPGELAGLLKLAGPAVAKEILLEGRLLTAQEAYEKGLLTRVVPDKTAESEAIATAGASPTAHRWPRVRTSSGSPACSKAAAHRRREARLVRLPRQRRLRRRT